MRFSDGSSSNKILDTPESAQDDTPVFNLVDLMTHGSHTKKVRSLVWNSFLSCACCATKEALPAGRGKHRAGYLCEHGAHVPCGDMCSYMRAEFMQVDDSLA